MFRVETIVFNPDYRKELEKFNLDYVAYVIEKDTGKVAAANIVARASLGEWYNKNVKKYGTDHYHFVLGTISVFGEILDAELVDSEKPLARKTYQPHRFKPPEEDKNVN